MSELTQIALLRGINVGKKNRIKMADLSESLAKVGLENVRTYIQSGNIALESKLSRAKLEDLIAGAIADDFDCDVPVLVREKKYFQRVLQENPFCKSKFDIAQLHVTLLSKKPSAKAVGELADLEFADPYEIAGDVVYLRLVSGYSKTKLTNGFLEQKLGVAATSRNWETICKLVEM